MERRKPTPDGRYPFSQREYYAFRELFGIVSTCSKYMYELEKRAKAAAPGTWRDLRLIEALNEKVMRAMLRTIPKNKLNQIQAELQHTQVIVQVNRSITRGENDYDDNLTYVSQRALERITGIAVDNECLFCEKCGKDVKRCQLRKDIESTYMFDIQDMAKDGHCLYAGFYVERDTTETEETTDDGN